MIGKIVRRLSGRTLAAALLWIVAAVGMAAGAPLPTASPESVGMAGDRLGRIAHAVNAEIQAGSYPGAVVMIARKGKLIYSEAFGEQKPGTKMSMESIFRIYSMTKPLVSVAAMMLVEEGKLELTDPVEKYLPGFDKLQVSVMGKDAAGAASYAIVPAERSMTVQDLLRHTSGLAYGEATQNEPVKDGYEKAGVWRKDLPFDARGMTPAEQVARLARVPLAYQPGTIWNYSLSVDVLGRVVEAASGQRLADFLAARVFVPLKMADTGFWVPAARLGRLTEPLPTDKVTGKPNALIDVAAQPKNDSGGAGGVSTAGDYLRFSQMLLNGGALDGARVVSPTTVRLMASDHLGRYIAAPFEPGELLLGVKGYTFGLGFMVRQGDGIAGVPGSAGEFMWGGYAGTFFWVDPKEQLTAVFMTQAPGPARVYHRKLIKQLVYQAIME